MKQHVEDAEYRADEEHEDYDLDRRVLELLAVRPRNLAHLRHDFVIKSRDARRETLLSLDYLDGHLLRFLMQLVSVAARAVLLPLDALRMEAFVLRGEVVAVFTIAARENDFVSWHLSMFQ